VDNLEKVIMFKMHLDLHTNRMYSEAFNLVWGIQLINNLLYKPSVYPRLLQDKKVVMSQIMMKQNNKWGNKILIL